jgi:hypothetical protein
MKKKKPILTHTHNRKKRPHLDKEQEEDKNHKMKKLESCMKQLKIM